MKERRTAILAIGVAVLFACAYFPVFRILVEKWANSDDYSHAFFVVPIILYMAWLKRESLVAQQTTGHLGLVFVLIANAFYLISLQLQIPSLIAIAMVMTVVSSLWYLAGWRVVRELVIPICLLVLVIPIPNQIYSQVTLPLQIKVSEVSALAIQGLGIPLFREGNVLSLPDKTFQVVEACSGLRSLISLSTLSLILGYFSLRRNGFKVLLVAASLPVAFMINIIRVTSLILAFHYWRLDLAEGARHTAMGLILFGIALVILFSLLRVLEHWDTRESAS
jgi:exosortase